MNKKSTYDILLLLLISIAYYLAIFLPSSQWALHPIYPTSDHEYWRTGTFMTIGKCMNNPFEHVLLRWTLFVLFYKLWMRYLKSRLTDKNRLKLIFFILILLGLTLANTIQNYCEYPITNIYVSLEIQWMKEQNLNWARPVYPMLEPYISIIAMLYFLLLGTYSRSKPDKNSIHLDKKNRILRIDRHGLFFITTYFLFFWLYICYYSLNFCKPISFIDSANRELVTFHEYQKVDTFLSYSGYLTPCPYFFLKIAALIIVMICLRSYLRGGAFTSDKYRLILWLLRLTALYACIMYLLNPAPDVRIWCGHYSIEELWKEGYRVFPSIEDFVTVTVSLMLIHAYVTWVRISYLRLDEEKALDLPKRKQE